MSVSIGEINGRVAVEIDMLGDYFTADDIHRAVVQRLNVRTSFTRSSDNNKLLGTTVDFTPTTLVHDITAEISNGTPAWIEFLSPIDGRYQPIRIVSLPELADYTNMGILAAAFWAEEPTHGSEPEATQNVQFSFLPPASCRIRFDRDLVRTRLTGVSLLPDHVADLISKEAQNVIIPKARARMAVDLRRNEELRKDFRAILATVDGMVAQNMLDIRDLERLWQIWAYRDPAAEEVFSNPTPSSRGLYGDSFIGRY